MHTPRSTRPPPATVAIRDSYFKVSKEKKGKVVDARCRDLTNAAVVNKARAEPGSVEVCSFHEVGNFKHHINYGSSTYRKNMNDTPDENILSPGIWTLADVLQHGRDAGTCPYFTIRRSVCSFALFFVMKG